MFVPIEGYILTVCMPFGNVVLGLVQKKIPCMPLCFFILSNFFVGLICQESVLLEQQWKKWKRKEETRYVF